MKRLAELRKSRNLSQKELAQKLTSSQNTISNWETGKREPDFETTIMLADYFDVTTDYLLGNEQKNKPVTERDKLTSENIDLFEQLPTDKKQQALDYLRYLVEHQEKE